MRRFSFSWSLASGAICLATFTCKEPWLLIGLLIVATIPPYVELRIRQRPTRLYVLHMAAFVALMIVGWASVERAGTTPAPTWALIPLPLAILIRCGTVPAHCWLTDWFEHVNARSVSRCFYVTPLSGVYAAVRLLLPIGPEWVLRSIGVISLTTAIYAAGMATIQQETRRFFAFLLLSHASLVLVGLELHTSISLTGSLCLWFSVILSIGGLGLTLRALESRFERLSLSDHHGLYGHSPTLAVCFLLTGLASVGFPGTLGFISTELLVDGAVEVNPYVGIGVVATAALNGIAVMRAYFLLFTGTRHVSTVSLRIGRRERLALLTLSALMLGGGLFPQPGVATRERATEEILKERLAPLPSDKPRRAPEVVQLARPNSREFLEARCVGNQGSSRIRRLRKSTGDPSDSRQRKPVLGLQPLPPETSSPLTHSRTSPLIARM